MFLVISRFTVANGMAEEVAIAFKGRPGLVDAAEGFERMEVMRGATDSDHFLLMTWWRDEHCYKNWHRSHSYHEAHSGIPKGLKLVPKSARVESFHLLCT